MERWREMERDKRDGEIWREMRDGERLRDGEK